MSVSIEGRVFVGNKMMFQANFNKLKTIGESGWNLGLMYTSPINVSEEEMKLYKEGLGEDETYHVDGKVYDFRSICNGLDVAEHEYETARETYESTESIRHTKDFYSFNDEERARYFDDVMELKESFEEYEWEVDAFRYARDVMLLASEIYDPDKYEYHDVEEVRLFLFYS